MPLKMRGMIRVGRSAAIKSPDSRISVAHAEALLLAVGENAQNAESGSEMILISVRIAVHHSIQVITHQLLAVFGEKVLNCSLSALR